MIEGTCCLHQDRQFCSLFKGAVRKFTRFNRCACLFKDETCIVYRFFHGKGTLTLYSTVYPNKHGACLEPETQQYDAGSGWHVDTKWGCDALDGASHDTAPFSLSQAVGARYRIRGDYFRSSRDATSTRKQGPWLYFIVTG